METLQYNELKFNRIYKSDFASVYYNGDLKLALCNADTQYIPIENFKEAFLAVSGLIGEFPMRHFLFDKRNLRTFHQPSMEWYFSTWKPMIREHGLTSHYKLLPDLEWFVQAVNAGKHDIYSKYGTSIMEGISINYMDSVENVIEHCQGKM